MAQKYISITRKKDRLREKLNALVPGINDAINGANEKSATELATAIKAAAPVATGEYRNSIVAKPVDDSAGRIDQSIRTKFRGRTARAVNTLAWGIFALYIWKYLEFGTRRGQVAQPHIMPLYRAYRKRIRSRNSREINKRIKQVVK